MNNDAKLPYFTRCSTLLARPKIGQFDWLDVVVVTQLEVVCSALPREEGRGKRASALSSVRVQYSDATRRDAT